jgi:anti-sigma regulatory factor (Ser/Thr protein kinase)
MPPGPAAEVERFIVTRVAEHPRDMPLLLGERFGLSREAANRRLRRLVRRGLLRVAGRGKHREHRLAVLGSVNVVLPLSSEFQEDVVWQKHLRPILQDLPDNVREICHHGFTEILNNAKDHSESQTVSVRAEVTAARVEMIVHDHGVGIFRKIEDGVRREDGRSAVLELTGGRLTTDPQHHTGTGLYFTSRMFDSFGLSSQRLALIHVPESEAVLIEGQPEVEGTVVAMKIATHSTRTAREVLERCALEQQEAGPRRSQVVVRVAGSDEEPLVSRSQAQRIVPRLTRFEDVLLDFSGVATIGPAFADEIFRVFRASHPEVRITPIHVSEDVFRMIRRVETAGQQ